MNPPNERPTTPISEGRDQRIRIACCQIAPRTGDLAGNTQQAADAIAAAAADGADLIVLPELTTSGYPSSNPTDLQEAGIDRHDPALAAWSDRAGTATVVGGFCELGTDGRVYNSAAVVDASGVLAVYRKLHLWGREIDEFTPGNDPPPVIDRPFGRLGVLVCYDMEFPEMTRAVALAGADVIAVPTNWPLVARPSGERPPEVVIAMGAARVNRVAIACCDRAGQDWTSGSVIIEPAGWVVATAHDGVARADMDLSSARDKVLGPGNHAMNDRRPDLYDSIAAGTPRAGVGR